MLLESPTVVRDNAPSINLNFMQRLLAANPSATAAPARDHAALSPLRPRHTERVTSRGQSSGVALPGCLAQASSSAPPVVGLLRDRLRPPGGRSARPKRTFALSRACLAARSPSDHKWALGRMLIHSGAR